MNNIKLVECPRDALQGLKDFVPTALKSAYLNKLLQVGFHTLDFGSFVSAKSIPQMRDTAEVLSKLELGHTKTKLLAIVANLRGAEDAVKHREISYLGFPFSVSETFQQRNTNSSIAESIIFVDQLLALCSNHNKKAVVYLSMGFGNPYGDPYNYEIVESLADQLIEKGVEILSLADTIGISTSESIKAVLPKLISRYNNTEIGIHLHSTPEHRMDKIEAAYHSGCKRIDAALKGYGGCPMATNELTGNLPMEEVIEFLNSKHENLNLNMDAWADAMTLSEEIFH